MRMSPALHEKGEKGELTYGLLLERDSRKYLVSSDRQ